MLLKEIVSNEGVNEEYEIENGGDSEDDEHDEKSVL